MSPSGGTAENSDTNNFDALFHSLEKVITSVSNAELRVLAAPDEQRILQQFEEKLTNLSALCDKTFPTLRYRRNQLSPINTLPDELLLNIFVLARSRKVSWAMFQYLPLTWICHRWRALAVEAPVLWSLIDIAYYRKNGVLEEYLRRSKGAKLSVAQLGRRPKEPGWFFGYIPLTLESVHDELAFFKNDIFPILHRVQSLELKLPKAQWQEIYPLLQDPRLSISRCNFAEDSIYGYNTFDEPAKAKYRQDTELCLTSIFDTQPLRVLELQYQHLPLARMAKSQQVHNLRTLVLKNDSLRSTAHVPLFQDLLLILELCRLQLEVLELSLLLTSPICHRMITMPRLATLLLHGPSDPIVFEYLSTPVLKKLLIDGRYHRAPISHCVDFTALPYMTWEDRDIYGFRKDHGGRLEYRECPEGLEIFRFDFEAHGGNIPTALYVDLISWASCIQSLTLDISSMPLPLPILERGHVLRHLSIFNPTEEFLALLHEPTVCPVLESLTCNTRKQGKLLVSLVRSRQDGPVPLKTLTVVTREALAKTHLVKLQGMVDVFNIIGRPKSFRALNALAERG